MEEEANLFAPRERCCAANNKQTLVANLNLCSSYYAHGCYSRLLPTNHAHGTIKCALFKYNLLICCTHFYSTYTIYVWIQLIFCKPCKNSLAMRWTLTGMTRLSIDTYTHPQGHANDVVPANHRKAIDSQDYRQCYRFDLNLFILLMGR